MTSRAALSVVYRMAGHAPPKRKPPDISQVEVTDDPLPPIERSGSFIAPGTGPWQRLAKKMRVGQSAILDKGQAECLRSACKRMYIRTASRTLEDGRVQIQILAKTASP
jgi:hypothetical protein